MGAFFRLCNSESAVSGAKTVPGDLDMFNEMRIVEIISQCKRPHITVRSSNNSFCLL